MKGRSLPLHSICYQTEPSAREGNGTPLQYSCLENPMDGGAWWAAVHGVIKIWTRLSDSTFTFHFHALEKEMATHSSVLAWRIPGTGESSGLPSMESHRVGHYWNDLAAAAAEPSAAERIKPQVSYFSHSSVPCKEIFLFHFSTSWKCNYKFFNQRVGWDHMSYLMILFFFLRRSKKANTPGPCQSDHHLPD